MNTQETHPTTAPEPRLRIAPPVDIFESEDEYLLVADLPGVQLEDVDLELERGELTLVAKRPPSSAEGKLLRHDRREGDFARVFEIPDEVDATKIEAKLAEGVLEVRLPKSDGSRRRRISIEAVG